MRIGGDELQIGCHRVSRMIAVGWRAACLATRRRVVDRRELAESELDRGSVRTMLSHSMWIEAVVLVGLVTGCKGKAADEPDPRASLIVEAPGDSPAVVARSVDKAWHSKLRIIATSGDTKQTRDYTVVYDGSHIALDSSNGVTTERPGAEPMYNAVAALSLAIGPHGEIDAPGARPEPPHEIKSSDDIGRVPPGAIPDEETANELRWLFVAIPSDAIGVGAQWRLEQDFYTAVGPVHQSIHYKLVRRDATELEVQVTADAQSKHMGPYGHSSGTVVIPLGSARHVARGSFSFSSGTLEMAPIE